jgi:hypothetical protein
MYFCVLHVPPFEYFVIVMGDDTMVGIVEKAFDESKLQQEISRKRTTIIE